MRKKIAGLFVVLCLLIISSFAVISVTSFSNINLKVMTYNVRDGCGYDENCGNYISDLVEVIRAQSPDILVIQEGNTYSDIRTAYTLLKKELTDYDSRVDGLLGRGTFVKKSFGNIVDFKASTYGAKGPSTGANPDRYYTRAEVFLVSAHTIIVYNTHLFPVPIKSEARTQNLHVCVDETVKKPSVEANKVQLDFSTTEKQAEELASIVAKETLPVIVMGDMNAESDHLASLKTTLSEVDLQPGHAKTFPIKPYCANTAAYGYQDWYQDLDHIFYNGFTSSFGTVVTTSPADVASDHYPVVASLTLDHTKIKKDICGNTKIAIMGASNEVEPSYANYLKGTCPGSTIRVFAEGGLSIQKQKAKYIDTNEIVNFKPDILIIDPSGNSCGGDDPVNSGIKTLNEIKEMVSKWQPVPITSFLTISPRHKKDNNDISKLSYQSCVDDFNQQMNSLEVTETPKFIVINLGSVLGGDPAYSCKYCNKEPNNNEYIHWTDEGDKQVAKAIFKQVFNSNVEPVKTGKITGGSSPSGVAPIAGKDTGATLEIPQGCAINQRCKDIDTAWNIFGGVLGLRSGQVWVPLKNTWMTFNDAYGGKQVTAQVATTPTSSGSKEAGTGLKIVQCATAKVDLNPEEKAFLDTIAYAEGTTSVALKKDASSYGVMVGGGIFTDYGQHPYKTAAMPNVVCVRKDADGKCILASSAAGRYQFMPGTYKGLKDKNFFQESFQPVEQDKGALKLAEDAGVTLQNLRDAKTDAGWDSIWNKVAPIWASIINSNTGKGAHEGQGYAIHSLLNKAYDLCLNYYSGGGTEEKTFNVNSGKETTDATTENDDSSTPAGPVSDQTPKSLSNFKVLVVGDSHIAYGTGVNPFGRELHRLLRTTGAQVQSYGSGASSPMSWVGDGKPRGAIPYKIDGQGTESKLSDYILFDKLKSDFNPDVVVIVLGTNIVLNTDPTELQKRIDATKTMADATGEVGCLWIGPPQRADKFVSNLDSTIEKIKGAVENGCTFIDSRSLADPNKLIKGDVHYTPAGGKEWAQNVFIEIEKKVDNKCSGEYSIDLGDGYRHKCLDAFRAQACAPLTGVALSEYSIAQIKDESQRNQLSDVCRNEFNYQAVPTSTN